MRQIEGGKRLLPLLLGAALLLSSSGAEAACSGLRFGLLPSAIEWQGAGPGYNVFDRVDRVQPVSFTVTKVDGTCTYFVTATVETGGSFEARQMVGGGRPIVFNVFTSSIKTNPIRDLPVATANDVITGQFSRSGIATNTHQHYYWIRPQQIAPPGVYSGIVHFKLYQGNQQTNTLISTQQVQFLANVRPAAEVAVVDPGAPFDTTKVDRTVNFGMARKGQRASFDLKARGNNGFEVTIQSQNGGVMRPANAKDTSTLPYTLLVNGQQISLAGGNATLAANIVGATGADGLPFPVQVEIGDYGTASPGNYTDVLTINVTSK
ncbi:MAG TPA: hypothetical protein VMU06_03565 [Stellaceae bacterium]|nr:hypothetical protein [Stellaceae bacterium]